MWHLKRQMCNLDANLTFKISVFSYENVCKQTINTFYMFREQGNLLPF